MVAGYKPLVPPYLVGTKTPMKNSNEALITTAQKTGLLYKIFRGGKKSKKTIAKKTRKVRTRKVRKVRKVRTRRRRMKARRTRKVRTRGRRIKARRTRKEYRGGANWFSKITGNITSAAHDLASKATAFTAKVDAKGASIQDSAETKVKGMNVAVRKVTGSGVAKGSTPVTGASGTRVPLPRMPAGPPGSAYSPAKNVGSQIYNAKGISDLHTLTSQYHHQ